MMALLTRQVAGAGARIERIERVARSSCHRWRNDVMANEMR
jgi:hypothetical protein